MTILLLPVPNAHDYKSVLLEGDIKTYESILPDFHAKVNPVEACLACAESRVDFPYAQSCCFPPTRHTQGMPLRRPIAIPIRSRQT